MVRTEDNTPLLAILCHLFRCDVPYPSGEPSSPPRHGSLKPSENRRPSNRERSASPRPRRSHHHDKRRLCSPSPRPLPSKPSAYPGPSNRNILFHHNVAVRVFTIGEGRVPPPLDLVRDRQVALRSSAPLEDTISFTTVGVESSLPSSPPSTTTTTPFLHHPHHLILPSRLIPDTFVVAA